MKFALLNRVGEKSYYKRALHEVLKTKGDTLLLGYGYLKHYLFDKNQKTKVSELLDSIFEGFTGVTDYKQIILVGSSTLDYDEFKIAAEKIHNHNPSVEVKLIIKKEYQINNDYRRGYHKKIAMKYNSNKNNRGNEPIIALLGSSNLTGSAYNDGLNNSQELDILIWNPFVIDQSKEELILDKIELSKDYKENFYKKSRFQNMLYSLSTISLWNIDFNLTFQLDEIINEINNYESNNFLLDLCFVDFSHIEAKDFFKVNTSNLSSLTQIIINQYKNKIRQNAQDTEQLSLYLSKLYDYFLHYLDNIDQDQELHTHQSIINNSYDWLKKNNKTLSDYIAVIDEKLPSNDDTKKLISCLKTKQIEGITLSEYLCDF